METISEAKTYINNNIKEGSRCPCCNKFVKLYRRRMNGSSVSALIKLNNLHRMNGYNKYFHSSKEYLNFAGDFAKLAHWDLIEAMPNDDKDKSHSGYWKITEKGIAFVNGSITVPSHILLYNAKCYGVEGDEVSIKDILGTKFSYEELMKPTRTRTKSITI